MKNIFLLNPREAERLFLRGDISKIELEEYYDYHGIMIRLNLEPNVGPNECAYDAVQAVYDSARQEVYSEVESQVHKTVNK